MPNWKKLIVSGSAGSLSSLTVDNNISANSISSSEANISEKLIVSGAFTASFNSATDKFLHIRNEYVSESLLSGSVGIEFGYGTQPSGRILSKKVNDFTPGVFDADSELFIQQYFNGSFKDIVEVLQRGGIRVNGFTTNNSLLYLDRPSGQSSTGNPIAFLSCNDGSGTDAYLTLNVLSDSTAYMDFDNTGEFIIRSAVGAKKAIGDGLTKQHLTILPSTNTVVIGDDLYASGSITGSDIQIDDWGSVSASLASISSSAISIPTLQQVTEQGSSTDQQINITGALTSSGLIYPTADGSDKEVLVTDGSGNLTFERPNVYANVKNKSGTTLLKGTPVHASSSVGNLAEVIAASASVASTMPATFVLNEDLADEAEGLALVTGFLNGIDTSAFSEGDVVYVGADGGYTNVKPTGSSNLIQNLSIVINVDASNGSGFIYGSGRSNDVPNLPTGKIWVGDGNTVTSSVVHLDETNGRLGIGTDSPVEPLDVAGTARFDNGITEGTHFIGDSLQHWGDGGTGLYFDTDTLSLKNDGGTTRVHIATGGDIGIGTANPETKLHIVATDGTNQGIRVITSNSVNGFLQFGDPENDNIGRIVYSHSDDSMQLYTNDSEQIRIASDGKVGIGTTSPQDTLHVEGNITASGNFYITDHNYASNNNNRLRITPNYEKSSGIETGLYFYGNRTGSYASNVSTYHFANELRVGTTGSADNTSDHINLFNRLTVTERSRYDDLYGFYNIVRLNGDEHVGDQAQVFRNDFQISGTGNITHDEVFANLSTVNINNANSTVGEIIGLFLQNTLTAGSASAYYGIDLQQSVNANYHITGDYALIRSDETTIPTVGGNAYNIYLPAAMESYLGGDLNIGQAISASGAITGSDIQVNDWGSVSASLASISSSAVSIPTLQQVTDQGTTTSNTIILDSNSADSPSLRLVDSSDITFNLYNDGANIFTITRQDNGGADFRLVADSSNYTESYIQVGNGSTFGKDATIVGDLTVQGTVTAQEFHTEFVSASIIYESGSTKFGDSSDDVHNFTGSINLQTSGSASSNYIKLTTAAGLDVATLTNGNSNTTPVGKLVLNYASNGSGQITGQSNGLLIRGGHTTNGTIRFNSYVTEMMRVTSTGLGIGTTSPDEKLTVEGNISGSGTINVASSITGSDVKIDDWGSVSASLASINSSGYVDGTGAANKVAFWTDADTLSNDTDLHWNSSNGRLGIGTSSPSEILDIQGDNPILELNDNNSTIRYAALKYLTSGGTWYLSSGDSNSGAGVANSDLWITRNATGTNNRFRFHRDSYAFSIYSGSNQNISLNANDNSYFNGGRVGIGTSNPSGLFVVDAADGVMVDTATTLIRNRESTSGDNFGLYVQAGTNASDISFRVADKDNTEYFRVRGDGNVSIGTTNADHQFVVDSGTTNAVAKFESTDSTALIRVEDSTKAVVFGVAGDRMSLGHSLSFGSSNLNILSGSGYVGIGTTSPDKNLHINDSNPTIRLQDSDGSEQWGQIRQTGANFVFTTKNGTSNGHTVFQTYDGTTTVDTLALKTNNQAQLPQYGSGTYSGTAAYTLAVDSSGNIIEESLGAGAVDGTGQANYITRWEDSNTVTSSSIYEDTSGNIGIGITSPAYKLDVGGTSRIGGTIHMYGAVRNYSGDFSLQNGVQDADILFKVNDGGTTTTAMMVDGATSNVGIGTTSPTEELEVDGNIYSQHELLYGSNNSEPVGRLYSGAQTAVFLNTSSSGALQLAGGDTTSNGGNIFLGGGDNASNPNIIRFRIGGTEAARFNSSGNLGIGTSSPTQKLTVAGNITQTSNSYLISTRKITARDGSGLSLYNDGGAGIEIKDDGNVGIGTTSPSQALTVEGAISSSGDIYIGNDGDTNTLHFNTTVGSVGKIVGNSSLFFHSDSVVNFIESDGNNTKLVASVNNGTLSINTSTEYNTAIKLYVNGDSRIDGTLQIESGNISYQENTDVDSAAAETVASVTIADFDAAFFDYVIKSGTNLRAGTVTAVHDGTNVEYNEVSTQDLGDTTDVTLSVDISGADMRLRATTTSDNWLIKSLVRTL